MIIIQPAEQENAYWIGSKFVFLANWELSKYRFTPAEQQAFERQVLNNPNALDVVDMEIVTL